MLKKIALVGIFAVISVVSLNSTRVSAAQSSTRTSIVGAPVMKGLRACGAFGC
jgi:hypothetical protein